MNSRIVTAGFASLVALTLCAMPAAAYEGGAVSGGGSVSGVVKFKGTPPAPKQLEATKDMQVCGKHKIMDETLVVGAEGGVMNAVVSIATIAKGKPLASVAPVLDQKGCQYNPHVLTVPAGTEVIIRNPDGILHNIHTYSQKNPPFNRAQAAFKKELKETFKQAETFKVACDAHNWMNGWIVVHDHPYYAVTDGTGAFKLTDVPAGDYELRLWHETLGETTQKITVTAGGEAKADFELAAK